MKRLLYAGAAAATLIFAVLAFSPALASAADSVVGTGGCVLVNGGQVTRPAGSTIIVRYGWGDVIRGNLVDFLHAQTTTLSINGGAPIDVSGLYPPPTQSPLFPSGWSSIWLYPTGITLANAGDSVTWTVTVSVSHTLAEVTGVPASPAIGGPGVLFD